MADTKKSCDIPITKEMLDETRSELKSDITSVRLEMKSGFNKVDAKFKEMDARFKEVDASINGLKSEMEKLTAAVHRVIACVKNKMPKITMYSTDTPTCITPSQKIRKKPTRGLPTWSRSFEAEKANSDGKNGLSKIGPPP